MSHESYKIQHKRFKELGQPGYSMVLARKRYSITILQLESIKLIQYQSAERSGDLKAYRLEQKDFIRSYRRLNCEAVISRAAALIQSNQKHQVAGGNQYGGSIASYLLQS